MRAIEKKRRNIKRWKKGHSCVSNPETKKHRKAAKNRFFNVISGPSRLTEAALAQHDAGDGDGDVNIDDDGHSASGRSASTWATNWTECTNITFSKVHRYAASNSAAHKSVLAVLAAITEVIKANDGRETDTEYFAALMTALDNSTNDEETITAITYLLSVTLKRLPVAVLRSKFAEASKLLMSILADHVNSSSPALVRSTIKCLAQLLRVQDQTRWSEVSTLHVHNAILSFTTHSKPKVRKAAHQAVCSVLFGSDIMTQSPAPPHHPAASSTAKYCISQIESCGGGGEATGTLHTLGLLQEILHVLPRTALKSLCETILKLMTLSNVMVTSVSMRCLHKMFKSRPDSRSMPAELNAQLITALYDFQPGDNDTQLMSAWLAVMKEAHASLAGTSDDLFISHVPRYLGIAMSCLKNSNADISKIAARSIVALVEGHLSPLSEKLGKIVSNSPNTNSAVHKMFRFLENGLSYQYHASWALVLEILAAAFQGLGGHCHTIMVKCLQSLADLRDSHKFPHKDLLDQAVGAATQSMGPRLLLNAIPLHISGEIDNYDFPRSWMLPVLRDHVRETELAFFTSYFLPLAAKLRTKAGEFTAAGKTVEGKTYDALQLQIWSLLPGFCMRPTDLHQSFKGLAKILGVAITDREDIRMDLLASLRKLILQNMENETNRAALAKFAKNFLPLLFNLFTTAPENERDSGRMAVLETIKIYVAIADQPLVGTYVDMCLNKLQDEDTTTFKRYALFDLCIGLVHHTDKTRMSSLLEYIRQHLKSTDRTIQKKSYRVLEMMCSGQAPACKDFIASSLGELQTELCGSLSSSSPSAKAPRLRCLCLIFRQLEGENMDFLQAVVPEAVLCTKETAEKARQAADGLLVDMAQALFRWNPDTPKAAVVGMYCELILAGLAGDPHVTACTLLALTRVTHEFKDYMNDELLGTLVESTCMLVSSSAREIVQAAITFLKELVARFDEATIGQFLDKMISCLVSMKEGHKHQLRFKAKEIFSRLVRKFGYAVILKQVPASHHKLLGHIKKMQERAARKKEAGEENSEEEDEEGPKGKPESFEDFLADSDSDLEEDKKKKGGRKGKKVDKAGQKGAAPGAAWLQETDEAIDFLDPSVSHKVLSTRPKQLGEGGKKREKEDEPFKMASDGRMIIQEVKEDTGAAAAAIDDLDELLDAFEGHGKKSRKRKLAADEEEEEDSSMKYKAGGGGIHRPVKKLAPGEEYKAKKARGDIKRKDKPDPYAYIPLNMSGLNRRKKAKQKGQFKSFVRGAQKGALKGQKIRSKSKKR